MTRERPRRRRFPIMILLLLAALAVTLSGIFPFRQIIAQRRSIELAGEQLAALQRENLHLEERISLLETPEEIERLAREQFGFVRPGEVAYVVVFTEDPPPTPLEPPATAPKQNWWDPIFEFFTGKDLDAP